MKNTKILLEYLIVVIVILVVSYVAFSLIVPKTYSINLKAMLVNNQIFYPYSVAMYRIYINNTGPNYIKNLTVATYIDNKTLNTYYVSLPAYKGAIINVSYEIPTNGNYIFSAIADPADLLNVENRANMSSSISLYANPAEAPLVYSSIPNNNIIETRSFSLPQKGLFADLYLSSEYNLTIADLFGLNTNSNVVKPLFYSLLNYIANINGAYVKYRNGTVVYSLWLQGPLNTTSFKTLLNKLNESITSYNSIIYTKLSNYSSLCVNYSGGWTKVLIGENQSGFNCMNMEKNYSPLEGNVLLTQLKNNKELISLQSRLEYSNSTPIGSIILSSNNTIGVVNQSINKYGFFLGYIQHNQAPSTNQAMACNGMVFNSINASVCSVVVPETTPPFNYTYLLINNTALKGNYLIAIYSLVNRTLGPNAQEGGAGIISSLNITGTPVYWMSTMFKNSCNSGTNSISCNIIGTGKNFSVNIKINNLGTSTIHLNSIACYLPGFEKNTSINTILNAGSSYNVTTECLGGTLSYLNPYIEYNLTLNYTLNNKVYTSNGILALSSTG